MAQARLALGDAFAARQNIEKAIRQDDRDARSWDLLGDAMAGLGDRATAEAHWRKSLLLRPDPAVQRKLGPTPPARPDVAPAFPDAQFRLRYDGGVNEPLGKAVMEALTQAYSEYAARLGFHPRGAGEGHAPDDRGHHGRTRTRVGRRLERRVDPRSRAGAGPADPEAPSGPAPRARALFRHRAHRQQLPDLAPGGDRAVARRRRSRARRRAARALGSLGATSDPADSGRPVPRVWAKRKPTSRTRRACRR